MRRLMHYGQILQSYALHFFHLSSPDLLFGFGSELGRRNIVGVAQAYPDIAKKGILLRKFGQEVIRLTAGKRVHGTGAVPGRRQSAAERRRTQAPARRCLPDDRLEPRRGGIWPGTPSGPRARHDHFGTVRSSYMSLVAPDGSLDLYHGVAARPRRRRQDPLRPGGLGLTTASSPRKSSLSYMKFPTSLAHDGPEAGLVQGRALGTGAELRQHPTPFAEHERQGTCRTTPVASRCMQRLPSTGRG